MAIRFDINDKVVKLYNDDLLITESPRRTRLNISGEELFSNFENFQVNSITEDLSFYVFSVEKYVDGLRFITLDATKTGLRILMSSTDFDLGSWDKPFTFKQYISQLNHLIRGMTDEISQSYRYDEKQWKQFTQLLFRFNIDQGDLLAEIKKFASDIMRAQEKAVQILSGVSTSNQIIRSYNFVNGDSSNMEEDGKVEFKEVINNALKESINENFHKYVIGFLNAEGGSIFWGIQDDGVVSSLILSSSQKDDIKRLVATKIFELEPRIDPTKIVFHFHEVSNVVNGYVFELIVPKSDIPGLYYKSNDTWVRLDAVCKKLLGKEREEVIVNRFKRPQQ